METFRIDDMTLEKGLRVRLHPGRKTISYGRDIFLMARWDLIKGVRQGQLVGKNCRLALGGQIGERELLRAAEPLEISMIPCFFGYLCTSMMVRQTFPR